MKILKYILALAIIIVFITGCNKDAPVSNIPDDPVNNSGVLPKLNLMLDKTVHTDIPLMTVDRAKPVVIPTSYDLRGFYPSYTTQGRESDCVAESTSDVYRILRTVEKKPDLKPSRNFIYYFGRAWLAQLGWPSNQDSGMTIYAGMHEAMYVGLPSESVWPYAVSNMFTMPPSNVINQAKTHKIQGLIQLSYPFSIDDLKRCISNKNPLMLGVPVYKSWYTWTGPKDGVIDIEPTNLGATDTEDPIGYHCCTIMAYDGTYIICKIHWNQNWGKSGFAYFTERFILKYGFTPFSATKTTGN